MAEQFDIFVEYICMLLFFIVEIQCLLIFQLFRCYRLFQNESHLMKVYYINLRIYLC